MWRFVEHDGPANRPHSFEPGSSVFRPNRWETKKCEQAGLESRRRQGGDGGAGTRDRFDFHAGIGGRTNQLAPWIRNSWGTSVRDQCDILAFLQTPQKARRLLMLVVLVKARRWCRDRVACE